MWRYNLTFTNLCLHLSVLIQELTSAIQNYIIVYALWQQISTAYIKLIFDNAIWCFNVLNVHKALILSRPIHLTRYLDKGLFQKCTVCTKFDIYGFFLPLYVWSFVENRLYFCPMSFDHCIVCPSFDHCIVCLSLNCSFWAPLWHLQIVYDCCGGNMKYIHNKNRFRLCVRLSVLRLYCFLPGLSRCKIGSI